MLDDAPWEWGSTGGWCNDMPEFFQGMPNGVYDNIWEDLDDSPVSWHITEVAARRMQLCCVNVRQYAFPFCPRLWLQV